jgi:outer membrane lipoprotein-sorting protein
MASRTALVAALLGSLTLVTTAAAQSVPLPTPAPQRSSTSQQPAAGPRPSAPIPLSPGAQQQTQTQRPAERPPTIRQPPQVRPGEATAFDGKQRALADRVSAYLSNMRTLAGDFVQVGPDGKKSQGEFFIQKPGRIRFDYTPPNPIELIADGSSVVVRDRKLATQDLYPLSQTPLRFLLADRIDLMRDTNLIGVYADDVFVTVVIEERQIIGGTHRLMLMFGAQDFQLKQWTITDPQGYDTTVAVYNLDTSKRPDPNMFRIDYTRQIQ